MRGGDPAARAGRAAAASAAPDRLRRLRRRASTRRASRSWPSRGDLRPAEESPAEEAPAAVAVAGHTAAISTSPLADLADRVAIAWAEVADRVADLPRPELPDWFYDRDSRSWRIVSAIAAAALVIGALILIQGGGGEPAPQPAAEPAAIPPEPPRSRPRATARAPRPAARASSSESTFSLALPAGWKQSSGEAGATFSASAPGGGADATLWIERDPSLEFPAFEARSLDQLEALAGSARVVERTTAPTIEATIIRLAADAPPGAPGSRSRCAPPGPTATTWRPRSSPTRRRRPSTGPS